MREHRPWTSGGGGPVPQALGGSAQAGLTRALPWWPWHVACPTVAMLLVAKALRPNRLGPMGWGVLALGLGTVLALTLGAQSWAQLAAVLAVALWVGGTALWGRQAALEGLGPELWHPALARMAWPLGLVAVGLWCLLRTGCLPEPLALILSGGTGDRPAWPFGHPNALGAALVLPCACLSFGSGGPAKLGVVLLGVAATGSRAAGLAALALLLLGLGRARAPWAWPLVVAVLLLAGLALGPAGWAHWGALNPLHPAFDHARLEVWAWTWGQSWRHPFLGFGPLAWWPLPLVLRPGLPHPHQAYLHLAWALGWPLAIAWVGLAWGAAWRLCRLGQEARALGAGLLAWWAIAGVDEAILELRLLGLATLLVAWAWTWRPALGPCA